MNYLISDLAKGLVDKSAKGRLTQDYKRKATVLENAWIKPNNSVAKRPGLRAREVISELPNIIDIKYSENRIYVLRKPDVRYYNGELADIERADQDLRNSAAHTVLDTVRTISPVQVISSNNLTIPGTPVTVQFSVDVINRIRIDDLAILSTHDVETGEVIPQECFAFVLTNMVSNPRDYFSILVGNGSSTYVDLRRETIGDDDIFFPPGLLGGGIAKNAQFLEAVLGAIGLTSDVEDSIKRKYDLAISQGRTNFGENRGDVLEGYAAQPGGRRYLLDLEAQLYTTDDYFKSIGISDTLVGKRQLTILSNIYSENQASVYEALSSPAEDESYKIAFPNGRVAGMDERHLTVAVNLSLRTPTVRTVDLNKSVTQLGLDEGENTTLMQDAPPSFFSNYETPSSMYLKDEGVGFVFGGMRYTLSDELRSDHVGEAKIRYDSLSEKAMNTFLTKDLDISIRDLPITATVFDGWRRNPAPAAVSGAYLSNISSLDNYISANRSMAPIYEHLKFALSASNKSETEAYVYPDITITQPGSDIPAYGTHLFSLNDDTHVFAADHSGMFSRGFIQDAGSDTYANGIGSAIKDFGIMLYVQRYNKRDSNGVPLFFPFPAQLVKAPSIPANETKEDVARRSEFAHTEQIIFLTLDIDNAAVDKVMDELGIISFYSSVGKSGMLTTPLVRSGKPSWRRNLVDPPSLRQTLGLSMIYRQAAATDGSQYSGTLSPDIDIPNTLRKFAYIYRLAEDITVTEDKVPKLLDFNAPIAEGGRTPKNLIEDFSTTDAAGTGNVDLPTELYNRLRFTSSTQHPNQRAFDNAKLAAEWYNEVDVIKVERRTVVRENPRYGRVIVPAFGFVRAIRDTRTHISEVIVTETPVTRYDERREFNFTPLRDGQDGVYYKRIPGRGPYDTGADNVQPSPPDGATPAEPHYADWLYASSGFRYRRIDLRKAYPDRNAAGDFSGLDASVGIDDSLLLYDNRTSAFLDHRAKLNRLRRQAFQVHINLANNLFQSSTDFVAYAPSSEQHFIGEDRTAAVSLDGKVITFSAAANKNILSLGFRDFISKNTYSYFNTSYLRASGLLDYILTEFPLEGLTSDTPDLSRLPARFDFPNNVVRHYSDTERGGVITSDDGFYTVSFTDAGIIIRRQLLEGMNTNAVTQSSMVIGGADAQLKLNRYYEEAGGYISDILNDETTLPVLKNFVSLFNHHQVIFAAFKGQENKIAALSFGKAREFKGISFLEFPDRVENIVKVDNNKLGVIFAPNDNGVYNGKSYGELDFTDKGTYDFTEGENYTYRVRPMPLLNVNEEDFSVTNSTSIQSFIVGFNGNPRFDYKVINSLTEEAIDHTFNKHSKADALAKDHLFEGQLWVNNVKNNGCELPELEISKTDGQHIEITSINIELGDI